MRYIFFKQICLCLVLIIVWVLLTANIVLAQIPEEASRLSSLPNEPALVVAIEIDGDIRAGTVEFIKRALAKAERENADLFLIRLDTPGGLLKATQDISRLILDSPVKTAVFVHKRGGWAFSAGAYLLLSAQIAAAHPESSVGAAEPRLLGLEHTEKGDTKITEASVSWIKRLAEIRGKNAEVAEKFVRENLVVSGKEALERRIVDFVALDTADLLKQLGMADARVVNVEQSFFETLLSFFSIPQVVPLLLTIGALGLIFAFRTGGFEIGVVAAFALLMGLWGIGAISVSHLGIALFALGIALLTAEFFAPEFGVFGIMGAISLVCGIIFFGYEPLSSPVFLNAATYFAIGIVIGLIIFFVVVGRLTVKTMRSKPKSGLEALVGREGIVLEELSPYGRISVDAQTWRARSVTGETVYSRAKVEITGFSGNTLLVNPVRDLSLNG
ncbi:nodulation protein NfeD [Patescibacteria group bacterium]|nr:nodulation protein NfeD [Patescibacteria group bacterium]MBU4057216.1 nodulation protein NfeD [Patescibacteria group bacterium]MBU4368670.1 nodulation protein NfeD [Patescibacteria group bacterium]